MNIKSIALVLFSMLILMSCKKDSDESGDTFPENIQGVWQREGLDEGDERGLYFTSKKIGYWVESEDCYFNIIIAELISLNGDNYRIRVISGSVRDIDEEGVIIFRVSNDMLTITYPDDDFEEIYSKDSRSIEDLAPKCSFEKTKNNSKFEMLFKSNK